MRKLIASFLFSFFALIAVSQSQLYKEKYRPRFHFSPAIHWTNDPNGLVYNNGIYHLFYQYNPMGIRWGHMSWGHAVSKDLLHWQHLPLAIAEEKDTMIFSGTCVVDKNNTSGFGKNGKAPMVAVYTGHIEGFNQSQHIAYSIDDGMTWTKYNKNPVLDLHRKDFRDPKIFWYDQKKYWVMALMLSDIHVLQFYSSTDLKSWEHLSDFGPAGDTSGVWECPDLTQVPVDGEPGKKKWLLQMSMNASMQYFIGEFDGVKFINESPVDKIFRPDHGSDYYAAITYNQLPASHMPTAIGWLNNWNYAQDIPTSPWRSMMSIPRTLRLKKIDSEWILLQEPIDAMKSLRSAQLASINNVDIETSRLVAVRSQQLEADLIIKPGANSTCGIRLAVGNGHYFEIGYNAATQNLYADRSKTGNIDFHPEFKKRTRYEAKLPLDSGLLTLKIFFDNSVVEVFANDGKAVMTMQLFPDQKDGAIEFFNVGEKSKIKNFTLWNIKSCW